MEFQIGDKVIHCNHGLGEVTQIEETLINEHKTLCYVVRTQNMTIWVPVINETGQCSLRPPTTPKEIEDLLTILNSPTEPLPDDRWERKNQLCEQLKDGKLTSICRVVRDLSGRGSKKRLNDEDKVILEKAKKMGR